MRVGGVQLDIAWQDPARNLSALTDRWIPTAVAAGAGFVVLPEMFATGFCLEADRIAEPADGPITTWLAESASRHGVWITGSIAVRDGDRVHNRMTLAGPAGEFHIYDKRHPFSFAGEDQHVSAGDELLTVNVDGLRVTPLVCYDLRFADDFWTAGPDTDVFVVVANWPTTRREHWKALLRARAIENQCYVVGVNRVGDAEGLDHVGDSAVIDPLGEVIITASGDETMIVAEIEAARVADVRATFPFLADRRPAGRRRMVGLPTDGALGHP